MLIAPLSEGQALRDPKFFGVVELCLPSLPASGFHPRSSANSLSLPLTKKSSINSSCHSECGERVPRRAAGILPAEPTSTPREKSDLPAGCRKHVPEVFPHAHAIAPAYFELREDGEIVPSEGRAPRGPNIAAESGRRGTPPSENRAAAPRLVFSSDTPFIRLYHGNSLELLDAIFARYGDEGRFDCIFADPPSRTKPLRRGEGPPYFLPAGPQLPSEGRSNGGITCHAGRMVRVDT